MNLIEESVRDREQKKGKKATRIVLIFIILLVMAIIGISVYLVYVQSTTLRVVLDGQVNEKLKSILFFEEDGTIYAPIKEIASYLNYDSYDGSYEEKSQEKSKCYVQNESEVANFALGSNEIEKLDLTVTNANYEIDTVKLPVIAKNGILYASSEAISKAFNVSFIYNQDKNRVYINTLPYLVQTYSAVALDNGYKEISTELANQKAILQDMLVVKKGDNEIYAVIDLDGKSILEAKYDNITYEPEIGDFKITSNKKVGILDKTGRTKVQPLYDSIELMDGETGLYVVQKDRKYGVLDLNGNTKIYIENDEIGMDVSTFDQNNIKNKYILAGNLIPARKDKTWGLYDKNGKLVVDYIYDSFGYVTTSNKDALSLLVIPDYNVLVACKNKKYTLLSSTGKELFAAPVADDIYMTISGGQKHYYITANNGIMDAEEYLKKIGVSKNQNTSIDINTNTSNNSNTNNNNENSSQSNQGEEQQNNQQQTQEQQNEDNGKEQSQGSQEQNNQEQMQENQ